MHTHPHTHTQAPHTDTHKVTAYDFCTAHPARAFVCSPVHTAVSRFHNLILGPGGLALFLGAAGLSEGGAVSSSSQKTPGYVPGIAGALGGTVAVSIQASVLT